MKILTIKEIFKKKTLINKKIFIKGWVHTRRDSKKGFSFLNIYDGSCINSIQIIVNNKIKNYKKDVLKLTTGCSVSVIGIIINSIGREQNIEIKAYSIKVIGWINNPETYPISSKKHSMNFLRKFSHLRPRSRIIGSVSRIRHTLSYEIHNFMNKNGFYWISTPLITSLDTEGSGNMFNISTLNENNISYKDKNLIKNNFFGKESFLTVSGQLNAESYACALSKVYTFGPTFRAEKSNTRRHLSEFWMIEPEIAFVSLNEIILFAENMLKYLVTSILNQREDEINFFSKYWKIDLIYRLNKFINDKFIQIEYSEVIKILQKNYKLFNKNIRWGEDLFSEHERFLSEKYFNSTIIIKNFPKNIKAFYMRLNDDNKTVASLDIISPGIGEIVGGSQREERLDFLDKQINSFKLCKKNYWWYRDLRRYGTVPHSGFGLGLERLIMTITGIKNIRDTIPFPRTPYNINF
ncbi:asparagine--tRNA ligase [Sodalis-like secondary symbiont of Drepanosiphum platanoidis]|uniref:asparagine--tRNA ligase n=1 Tax=Sodalis-like secondary symbiont of Drepanosiphum platanoidis TaxID=2994493 RepID=UPI0034641854